MNIKDFMRLHKNKIKLLQWAIINGFGSVIYAEYISRICHRSNNNYDVPSLENLKYILRPSSDVIKELSYRILDDMINNRWMENYKFAPEMEIFNVDNKEYTRDIIIKYIIPDTAKIVSSMIVNKFDLNNEKPQIRQNSDICITNENIDDYYYRFISYQALLNFISLSPTISKITTSIENNKSIKLYNDTILNINNQQAIWPIKMTNDIFAIFNNTNILKLINFVTSTSLDCFDVDSSFYVIRTNPFNKCDLIKIGDIDVTLLET